MALSLANFLIPLLALLGIFEICHAATVNYDLNITWTTANPDGAFERGVIGINGQWPPPVLYATKGDRVVVRMYNDLKNESTSLHFHGIFQNRTTQMDGAAGATQCHVPPGSYITYNFTIDQPGTYWYHSHVAGQYPDGLRAPLIVNDPDSPFKDLYDEEVILSFSDWYHDHMPVLINRFLNLHNPTGAEPVPNSALMNDTQGLKVNVKPGKTYLFRMVNMGAFAAHHVWFEGHTMKIVEVDGAYVEPTDADMIYVTVAQRYGVLITAKNDTSANFAIVGSMDEDLFDTVPDSLNPNVTSWLTYDASKPFPDAQPVNEFNDFDDFTLVPYDKLEKYPVPDNTVLLTLSMQNLDDGENYAMLNDVTYVMPKVPTIYSALTLGNASTEITPYGPNTNAFMLTKGQVVEIVLNNDDPGKHPFHLHGHNFQLIYRSDEGAGFYANNITEAEYSQVPVKRDTVLVKPNGYVVLRFIADNPGIWLFHCHIEWHMISGLAATLIEDPVAMRQVLEPIPDDHYAACKAAGIPTAGNAAGNTQSPDDLDGANRSKPAIPGGFTPRGIVALVFSCIAAFLGCAVIAWYGWAPLKA